MKASWTYGRKLAIGVAIIVAAFAAVASTGLRTTRTLIVNAELVAHTQEVRTALARLGALVLESETSVRGYVVTGKEQYVDRYRKTVGEVDAGFEALRQLTADNPNQQRSLAGLRPQIDLRRTEFTAAIEARRAGGIEAVLARATGGGRGQELSDDLRRRIGEMDDEEVALLATRRAESDAASTFAEFVIQWGGLACVVLAIAVGWFLSRLLTERIGTAVLQVQSSSSELQAAANQQVSGARDQVTAMGQISTTMTELLATSRQISEGATRVSQIAKQTGGAADAGTTTVDLGNDATGQIRRQVDIIVGHMLELGKKSQQAGAVLDIVGELAEQTNIVAINAAIEAAGAGDAGRRFGVVADEIRKLADRVTTSTKDIRAMLDDVRGAVTATVMATETGSKAVDAGASQVAEMARSFRQITSMVATTVEATREIELSTKQQASAVEQVHQAISALAQTTRETEAGATQTLQTSSQLTSLSSSLTRLVQARS